MQSLTVSSGMNRIPSYMARVSQGVLDAKATPELTKLTPVVAQVTPISRTYESSLTNI